MGSLLTTDSAYTYYETYDIALQSYNSSPTIPTYLVEANYEYDNNTGALPGPAGPYVLREQSVLDNAQRRSQTALWKPTLYRGVSPGVAILPGQPRRHGNTAHQSNFLTASWWNLVPDATHTVVTAGYGTYNGSNMNLTTATYCTTRVGSPMEASH